MKVETGTFSRDASLSYIEIATGIKTLHSMIITTNNYSVNTYKAIGAVYPVLIANVYSDKFAFLVRNGSDTYVEQWNTPIIANGKLKIGDGNYRLYGEFRYTLVGE